MLHRCSDVCFESGGILGGYNGTVTQLWYDEGIGNRSIGAYYPDVDKLNEQISLWQKNNISFYGVFHSHFQSDPCLSYGDKETIHNIMLNMPSKVFCLYFPLVLPMQNKVYSFKATRNNDKVTVAPDKIVIIKGGNIYD